MVIDSSSSKNFLSYQAVMYCNRVLWIKASASMYLLDRSSEMYPGFIPIQQDLCPLQNP